MKEQIQLIKNEISKLQDSIEALQEACTHDSVVYEYGDSTGNFCQSLNAYWVDFKCLDCDKSFHYYDDDNEGYSMVGVGKVKKIPKNDYEVIKKYKGE